MLEETTVKVQVENMQHLAPLYLGVKAVIAKSFARIHKANLINNGIVPMEFKNEADYDSIDLIDDLKMENIQSCFRIRSS